MAVTLDARVAVPSLASGVQLLGEMRGSGYRRTPSLVRRADGETITLTPLLYATLLAVDGHRDLDQVARAVSAQVGREATADDVAYLLDKKLRPLGLVRGSDGSEPSVSKLNPLLALRLRFAVTNPTLTRRLTAPFAWLFHPAVALPVLLAFALTSWWLLFEKGLASATHQAFYQPAQLLLIWAVIIGSAAFHEFGHAAACRYGGATPGVMGAGLYLVWPAFYTEVSDSYRLGRWGRLRVDLGGLYFNAIFALGTVAAWALTRNDALLLVVVAQHVQMVRQLAPFIRADGYHIVADLTGVPDLFAHIKPTLLSFVPRRWGGRRDSALKTWARVVVTAWVVVVVPLLVGLLFTAVQALPHLAATAWDSMGRQWDAAGYYWERAQFTGVLVRILYAGVVALPVLGILYVMGRVGLRTRKRVWAATEGRPRQRALAVTVGALVLGVIAWSWWPSQQYRPIRGDEGGTLDQVFLPTNGSHADIRKKYLTRFYTLLAARPPALGWALPNAELGAPASFGGAAGVPAPSFYVVQPTGPAGPGSGVLRQSSRQPIAVVDGPGPNDWVFPFPAPAPPGEGDNRAMSVNTQDGTYATALAVAWAIISDGSPVDQRNEAYAFASCTACSTLAVSMQVLLLVGNADVAPVNTAEAVNYDCVECRTAAIATQLVVSLTGMPSQQAQDKVAAALGALDTLEPYLGTLSVDRVFQVLTTTKEQILQVLRDDGVLASDVADVADDLSALDSSSSTTPAATPTDTASTDSTDSTASTGTAGPTATDSTSATASSSPSDTSSSSPSVTADPTPTATDTTAAPSPTDTASPSGSTSP